MRHDDSRDYVVMDWQADEAAITAGAPPVLTGGMVSYLRDGRKVLAFSDKQKFGRVINVLLDTRPELAAEVARREGEIVERKRRRWTIWLSARGWGDYSPCEWIGDITQDEAEILAECKHLLASMRDVDQPNQSDAELLNLIRRAKQDWADAPVRRIERYEAEKAEEKWKKETGLCPVCETWCYDDCKNIHKKLHKHKAGGCPSQKGG